MISVPGNHQHHAALQGRGATQVSNYLIREFSHFEPPRTQEHDEVHKCGYTSFVGGDGKAIFQFNTYGKGNRAHPEKVSQAVQLDEEGARTLIRLLKDTFSSLRDA